MKASPPSSSSLIKNLFFFASSGIVIFIFLFLFGFWQTSDRLLATVESILQPPAVVNQADVTSSIIAQISDAQELTTAIYTTETVVPTSAERKWGDFTVGKTKLLYIARGEVKAGIDLQHLTSDKVKVERDSIQIELPAPQILDSKIDVGNSRVYDYDRGLLNLGPDVAPQLHTLAQQRTLTKIVEAACNEGILDRANQKATATIHQLLSIAGYQQIEIKTQQPSPKFCAVSRI